MIWGHIGMLIGYIIVAYIRANQINETDNKKDDKYLWRKWKKLKFPFYFSKCKIRCRAYWYERVVQYTVLAVLLIWLVGCILMGPFSFFTNELSPIYWLIYTIVLFTDGGIGIYVLIRSFKDKLKKS